MPPLQKPAGEFQTPAVLPADSHKEADTGKPCTPRKPKFHKAKQAAQERTSAPDPDIVVVSNIVTVTTIATLIMNAHRL